jgi:hypothetical protein
VLAGAWTVIDVRTGATVGAVTRIDFEVLIPPLETRRFVVPAPTPVSNPPADTLSIVGLSVE